MNAVPPPSTGLNRRGFLDWVLRVCGTILGVGILGPAVAYIWPSTQKGPVQHRQDAGPVDDWAVWTAKKISVGEKPAIVVRMNSGFRAFSAICSHLGCLISWNIPKQMFECPCHGAFFDQDGKVVAGPPPKPMVEFTVSVVEGKVYVSA